MIAKVSTIRSAGHSRHIRKHFSLLLGSVLHELVTNMKSESMKAHMYRLHVKLYGIVCVYMFAREDYKMQIDQN
jgi:hypothetical protein